MCFFKIFFSSMTYILLSFRSWMDTLAFSCKKSISAVQQVSTSFTLEYPQVLKWLGCLNILSSNSCVNIVFLLFFFLFLWYILIQYTLKNNFPVIFLWHSLIYIFFAQCFHSLWETHERRQLKKCIENSRFIFSLTLRVMNHVGRVAIGDVIQTFSLDFSSTAYSASQMYFCASNPCFWSKHYIYVISISVHKNKQIGYINFTRILSRLHQALSHFYAHFYPNSSPRFWLSSVITNHEHRHIVRSPNRKGPQQPQHWHQLLLPHLLL